MERKHLKCFRHGRVVTQVGVGRGSDVPERLTDFTINAREREVLYIKSAKLFLQMKIPAAGNAWKVSYDLVRSKNAKDLYRHDNDILSFTQYDADSYVYYAGQSRGMIQDPTWCWPEGFEPVFLDCPYMSQVLEVFLNAGSFSAFSSFTFMYWIEKVSEKEYEKLRLEFGDLG